MFKLKKFSTPSAQLSFQETRDLSWCIANPDICFNVSKHMLIDGVLDRDLLIRAVGKGARENIVGTGSDNAADALDRRVEFRVLNCG